jgi:protocadherin Fat 1/2/3
LFHLAAHVSVHVSDSSDNSPNFEQLSYECVLSQEATRGQFVTVLSANDADYSDANKLIYTIVEGNDHQTYHMDPMTGVITLMNMQNFGNTADSSQPTILNVSVTDGVYTSYTRVKITILPANLHNPTFEKLVYEFEVNENQLPGRLVGTVKASDDDFGKYGHISYSIVSDEMNEVFDVDSEKGVLTTRIKLDRERRSNYEILIRASDDGARVGYTTVRVKVADENDFSPQFINAEYKLSIPSNISKNIVFHKIKAIDLDENQNAAIKYSIYDAENKGIKDVFGINEKNGGLFLKIDAQKFENQPFQFFVRAHDSGSLPLYSDVPVNVYVMASSENPPVFEKREKTLFLTENSEPGTLICRVTMLGNVTANLRIISNDDQNDPQFTINNDGELKLGKTLDRETRDIHYIDILAETDSSPPLTAVQEIELRILDINDATPSFESNLYSLSLAENIGKGTSILKVHAHDAGKFD